MTRLSLALALMIAAPAAAQDKSIDFCVKSSKVAETAMAVRQTGEPIHRVLSELGDALSGDDLNFATELIEVVYKVPLYSTAEDKARAVSEFANGVFRACRRM